jgi:general secretion pathway protein F
MQFLAKTLTAANTIEIVRLQASNIDEVRHIVETRGDRLISAKKAGNVIAFLRTAPRFDLPLFNRQLLTLIEAGQPITDAVQVLSQNDKRGLQRPVYSVLIAGLQQGKQLSATMGQLPSVFPPLYIAMLEASETTGNINDALKRYIQYQSQADEIRNKLVSAAIYPTILASVGIFVIGFLMLYVVPKFSAVFDDISVGKQGIATAIQIWGTFVRNNQILAWGAFIFSLVALVFVLTHSAARSFAIAYLFRTPWLGERLWVLQLARLYRSLGMLLRGGIHLLAAMKMTKASLPTNLQPNLQKAMESVSEGNSLSRSLFDHGLSNDVSQRLIVAGESSGSLAEMMERIADFFDQETANWIDKAGRLIEPLMMVVIGVIIGIVVLMLYSPIFDLANAV